MTTILISFVRLLRDVCEQVHMDVPPCVVSTDTEGKFVAYIDIHITRNDSIVELIRCWSGPSSTAGAAEEEASHNTVKRLTQELDLHVRDVNYDDALFYKSMNDQLTLNLSNLANHYNKLVWDYNFLKDCYVSTAAQKNELTTDRLKIPQAIEECNAVINGHPSLPLVEPPTVPSPVCAPSV